MNRAASWTVLAVATLAVSTAGPFLKLAGMDAFAVVLLRMALAAPLFLAWGALSGGAGLPAAHAGRVALGGLLLAAHFLLWVKAFDLTSYASNLLLLIAQPILAVPLGARIGERPTRSTWLAVMLAAVGLWVIAQGDLGLGAWALLGDACSVLGGLAITLYFVVTRHARAAMPIGTFMGWTMLAGASAALPVVLVADAPILDYPAASFGWLAGLVLATTVAGHGLMNLAARHHRLFTINIVIVLEPAIAIGIGVLWLGESVTLRQVAGGAVLAAAVAAALLPEWRTGRGPVGAVASPAPSPAPSRMGIQGRWLTGATLAATASLLAVAIWRENCRPSFGSQVGLLGDVDGDGVKDFAVLGRRPGRPPGVTVFSGRQGRELYRAGSRPFGEESRSRIGTAGDLDGDGVADFAVNWCLLGTPSWDSALQVLSGRKGRQILSLQSADLREGEHGEKVVPGPATAPAGDVDGDGTPDIAIGIQGARPDYVAVLSGRSGLVLRRIRLRLGDGEFGHSLAGGDDLDGDGFPDLVAGAPRTPGEREMCKGRIRAISGREGRSLWAYDGGGRDARHGDWGEEMGFSVQVVADVDGDGTRDVFGGGGHACRRAVLLSGRTGRILHEWRWPEDLGMKGDSLTPVSDLDGDGIPDITGVFMDDSGVACVFPSGVVALGSRTATVLWKAADVPSASSIRLASGADLDGDGTPDIVAGCCGFPGRSGTVIALSGKDGRVLYRIRGGWR